MNYSADFVYLFVQILGGLLYTCLYAHHWELMKSRSTCGQIVTAIHDEGDGLTLYEQLS
jgi:hypothetical protein